MNQYRSFSDLSELGYSGAAFRPKSSPAKRYHGKKSQKINRPKTAAAVLLRTECDRVNQLQHEPTRRHNFENHLPVRKPKTPAWQKNLDPPPVPIVVSPGYVLSKSKSKCSVILREDFFDPGSESPVSPSSPLSTRRAVNKGDPERDSLIATLQEQINDLTLYLEEERLNHRQSKQKSEEYLKDRLEDLANQHKHHIKELKSEHKYNLKNLENVKEQEFNDFKDKSDQQMHKMVTEIEFLQGAFESYKGTLEQEMEVKWNQKEEELKQQLESDKTDALVEFKSKVQLEKTSDKSNLKQEFQRQKEVMRREHKKEIESMVRRYATAAVDIEKSKRLNAELEEVKAELSQVKSSYLETSSQLNTTSRQLTDTKVRLLEYEEQFQDKVQAIDDKYRLKIDDLMRLNIELRQLYVKKCGQLFEVKDTSERKVINRVTSAKQTMEELIKVKERANVNLIANDPDLEKRARKPKTRPGSAPTTHIEGITAHLSAGETDHLQKHEEFIRPNTVLPTDTPEIEKLRKDLFAEGVREYTKEDLLKVLQS